MSLWHFLGQKCNHLAFLSGRVSAADAHIQVLAFQLISPSIRVRSSSCFPLSLSVCPSIVRGVSADPLTPKLQAVGSIARASVTVAPRVIMTANVGLHSCRRISCRATGISRGCQWHNGSIVLNPPHFPSRSRGSAGGECAPTTATTMLLLLQEPGCRDETNPAAKSVGLWTESRCFLLLFLPVARDIERGRDAANPLPVCALFLASHAPLSPSPSLASLSYQLPLRVFISCRPSLASLLLVRVTASRQPVTGARME